jgi:hypothetical protein
MVQDQVFYVPIPDVKKNTICNGDEDFFYMKLSQVIISKFQLQQETIAFPNLRKYNWFGAYGEGWALYTESLGKELDYIKTLTTLDARKRNAQSRSIGG